MSNSRTTTKRSRAEESSSSMGAPHGKKAKHTHYRSTPVTLFVPASISEERKAVAEKAVSDASFGFKDKTDEELAELFTEAFDKYEENQPDHELMRYSSGSSHTPVSPAAETPEQSASPGKFTAHLVQQSSVVRVQFFKPQKGLPRGSSSARQGQSSSR